MNSVSFEVVFISKYLKCRSFGAKFLVADSNIFGKFFNNVLHVILFSPFEINN